MRDLVDEHTSGRTWGVLGEPQVNVLDAQHRRPAGRAGRLRHGWRAVDAGAPPGSADRLPRRRARASGKTYADARRGAAGGCERGTDVVVGLRRDPRPRADRGRSSRGSRWCRARRSPTAARRSPRWTSTRCWPARPAVVLRRRARAHQRAGQPAREAGRGRRASCWPPGIDVITTVNIQHLESLNDEVERITGVRQRETVPGRGGPHGRPDPARRHVPRRAAPPDGARQHLQAREGRRLAHVVLPGRQPHRAARARAAVAGRPGRRRSSTTTGARTGSRSPGRPRSGSSSRSPAAPRARP